MSSILDILIKKDNLKDTKLKEIFNECGGEVVPFSPAKFEYKEELIFHQNDKLDIYYKLIDNDLNGYIALSLEGNALSDLEVFANRKPDKVKENELLIFIDDLFSNLKDVILIKFLNEETIDYKYSFDNLSTARDVFLKSLNWDSPKGVIICK